MWIQDQVNLKKNIELTANWMFLCWINVTRFVILNSGLSPQNSACKLQEE